MFGGSQLVAVLGVRHLLVPCKVYSVKISSLWVVLPRKSSKTSLKRRLRWEEEGDEEQLQNFDAPSVLAGPPKSSPAPVTVKVKAESSTNANNEAKEAQVEGGWHQI